MNALTFDTLKYAETLEAAGIPREQARAQASALSDVLEINLKELVTKSDLKTEMAMLRQEMIQLEQRMTIKLGAMLVVAVGVVATLVKLL